MRRPGAFKIQPASDSTRVFARLDTTSTVVHYLRPGPEAIAYDQQGPFVLVALAGYGHRGYALRRAVVPAESPLANASGRNAISAGSRDEVAFDHDTDIKLRPVKDPDLALVLSIIVPGAGHLYAGEAGRGTLLMLLGIGSPLVGSLAAINSVDEDCLSNDCSNTGIRPVVFGLVVGASAWLIGIADAKPAARRANRERRLTFSPAMIVDRPGITMRFRF